MLTAYTAFLLLAAAAAFTATLVIGIRRGLPAARAAGVLLAALGATWVGARALYAITHAQAYRAHPEMLWSLQRANLALDGGIVAACALAIVLCRTLRLDLWKLADASAPGVGLGIALSKIGCFLNGCCGGKPTNLPWGVTFPSTEGDLTSSLDWLLGPPAPVHPTQIYEAAAGLAGAFLALWILRRRWTDGTAFLVFAMWFTWFRWSDSYLRVPSTGAMPEWLHRAWFAGLLILSAVILAARRIRAASGCGVGRSHSPPAG